MVRVPALRSDVFFSSNSQWFESHAGFFLNIVSFLSHLLLARCDIGVQLSVRSFVRSFVRPSVRPSTICVESGNKLHFFAAVVAVRMKPCIVIVLDTLFKQAP